MHNGSAIYKGTLRHSRTTPRVHDFKYQVVLFYLDLNEVKKIFRFPWLVGFRRKDYLQRPGSLDQAVRDLIFERTGRQFEGAIRVLTQISYFGFCFNPVSFYYCFATNGELEFIVSEITNTPWHERKAYVLECQKHTAVKHFEFEKDFHVSPFMPMDLYYVWEFNIPRHREAGSPLWVRMEDWDLSKKNRVFDAILTLKAQPLTQFALYRTLLEFPLLTFKAFIGIYFQALILKLKRVPFYSHPATSAEPTKGYPASAGPTKRRS